MGKVVLGIESSCDETAAAVLADGRRVLSSVVASQDDVHAPYGGVVPELASRRHLEVIVPVVEKALTDAGVALGDLDGIAVTYGPGLVGSLLVGCSMAKALAWVHRLPLVGVNHLEGHIYAAFLTEEPPEYPVPGPRRLGRPHRALPRAGAADVPPGRARPATTRPAKRSTRWPSSWASGSRAGRSSSARPSAAIPARSSFRWRR